MEKISKYISYVEATKSLTAIKHGIANKPDDSTLKVMQETAAAVFDPVREHFNIPIGVTSFFRSPKLNTLIGGSKTSQHVLGEAVDIDADMYGGITNRELFFYILDNLEFDQLIWEFGNEANPDWVHVSYKKGKNRKQVLKALKVNGKTVYRKY